MSTIVIKDLPESVDLDHQAMVAIIGGARVRGRQTFPGHRTFSGARIINYSAGFGGNPLSDTGGRTAGSTLLK